MKPEIIINEEQLRSLMALRPKSQDVAAFFKCSIDTLERYLRKNFNMTFAEFREENTAGTRFSLSRTAIEKALAGDNVMLIFCLKNFCGWSNEPVKEVEEPENKYKQMSTVELIKLVKDKVS